MMPPKVQNRIFLCHASEDKEKAIDIYNWLKLSGFNPWLDKKDLLPGQDWDKQIEKAIEVAQFVIIFFSKNSVVKRGYVQKEFKLALNTVEKYIPEQQIFIIPVKLDDCEIPDSFKRYHYIDLFEEEGLAKIAQTIKMHLDDPIIYGEYSDSRDKKIYKTIEIDGKVWFAENLNYDVDNSWFHNDDPMNENRYGRLYTWNAGIQACPNGWRIPTIKEWLNLAKKYGGELPFTVNRYRGEFLNDIDSPKRAYFELAEGGKSGFNALLGGSREPNGTYWYLGKAGAYWSSTIDDDDLPQNPFYVDIGRDPTRLFVRPYDRSWAFSCRCVKD